MAAVTPRRARLGARLRALREQRFASGLQFAEAVGWPQSRVSKLERGAQLPTSEDLRRWLQVTDQPDELLDDLLEQLAAALVDYTPDRDVVAGSGLVARQDSRRLREASALSIVEYQPSFLPGLVQTPAYAREVLTNTVGGLVGFDVGRGEVDALVAARMRRQEVLYDPARSVEIIVGEAALYSRPGTVETMRGQLDRLLVLADLAGVGLRIVPFSAPLSVLPLTNFTILDGRTVIVESLTGEQEHTADDEVAVYTEAARRLTHDSLSASEMRNYVKRGASQLDKNT